MGLNQFGDFIDLDPDQYFTNFVDYGTNQSDLKIATDSMKHIV